MRRLVKNKARRATVLVLIVGLLAMLFMVVSAYITLARFDRLTTRLASRGQQTQQILGTVTDVLAGQIAQVGTGDITATLRGANYAATPGGKGTPWLAGLEPVLNPSAPDTSKPRPVDYTYSAVTSLTGNPSVARRVGELMFGDPNVIALNGTAPIDPTYPDQSPYPKLNARQPFMDADGDGVSDSGFHGVALLTELANAMAGKALSIDLNMPAAPNDPRWQYYDSLAQYEVAAKIVPHGGMVQVGDPNAWNAQFAVQMFNWLKHPYDTNVLNLADPTDRAQLTALGAASASVEPFLRARGGLLTSQRGQLWSDPAVPPAVRALAQPPNRFETTMLPFWDTNLKTNHWERFNLASSTTTEWDAWRQAVSLAADEYNAKGGGVNGPRNWYVPRRLLTTVNNSDELARKQQPDPNNASSLGIRTGQLKFYLGDIQKAFNQTTGVYNPATGFPLVRELADYYGEMLAGYDPNSWLSLWWDPNSTGSKFGKEGVSRRQQAFMLAVNTVGFAAPRVNGIIDTPCYTDPNDPGGPVTYYGYTPQPFITQVIADNGWTSPADPNDPNTIPTDPNNTDPNGVPLPIPPALAVAIELYNPYDSDPNTTPDLQALDLARFALTIGLSDSVDPNSLGGLAALSTAFVDIAGGIKDGRFFGRRYAVFAAAGGSASTLNQYFKGKPQVNATLPVAAPAYQPTNAPIVVRLWQLSSTANWYQVDEMKLDPTKASFGDADPNTQWYLTMERDTHYENYLGRYNNQLGLEARWRMVTAFDSSAGNTSGGVTGPGAHLTELGTGETTASAAGNISGPCVPLYEMNPAPAPGQISLHGALRPASFPTPGFLLFVPRFSHAWSPAAPAHKYMPMTRALYEEWDRRQYTFAGAIPADFGHMPIFENKQRADPAGDFTNAGAGRVPWGLLVFDHFTTLDPNIVDPHRVPGRININDAPWYVLAGLPVISPSALGAAVPNASPSFWNASANILVGTGVDGTNRRPMFNGEAVADAPVWDAANSCYRLGPVLAQAVAAFRDRVPYVTNNASYTPSPWGDAWRRNAGGVGGVGAYRPEYYGWRLADGSNYDPNQDAAYYPGGIRGADPNSHQSGFLTIGELANVVGFDSSRSSTSELVPTGDPGATVLGKGDFMKAVSLLALLDTHFLTTRSNTYTIYTTLTDRQDPQRSVHAQTTIDRTKLLPHLTWQDANSNGIPDPGEPYTTSQDTGSPEIIGERQVSYFNTRYDE